MSQETLPKQKNEDGNDSKHFYQKTKKKMLRKFPIFQNTKLHLMNTIYISIIINQDEGHI